MLDFSSIEILLIEDEPAHAELIQRAFQDRAPTVQIEHVSLLSQARQYLSSKKPDLIITDWRLPDGDGLEVLSGRENSLNTPVIFMTSYGSERIAVEAMKSGAVDYVVKSPESLMDMPHIAERAVQQGAAKVERIRMQEALARSESQFRLLAENASDMISRHDTNGVFLYTSPASQVILGFEPEELIGRTPLEFIHPEDLPRIRAMGKAQPKRDSVSVFSYRAKQKDGQYVWLETSARAILDEKTDSVIEIQAASRDITERKRSEEAIQLAHQNLQEAYDRTIEGWVRALDLRDRETEGHTQRVTEMTLKVARALGLPESEIVHIRRGALLHDIGKIAIPDEITKKTGPLNRHEWDIMRKHPEYAYEMLSPIAYLKPALDIPYCHHERWDGSGYPRGLKGEEIPLTARLFAVVDVWDALISERPYRKPTPLADVIAFLKQESGRLFDARLVDLFLRVLKQETA
ncbi:MAG TPA: HD domain-containing phosphohydrolase [Anaerolineales bacterium]|nr:HD domain-containing phosphohydrolase [Anaerolineales bacterium]